ncbi:hypothetical protein DFS34DRAFT_225264 [Phlyctochytrium arcticum]|nr:hypothetical protein DFS34DRAFT_225264 [Phlyctochytrium arcticum]
MLLHGDWKALAASEELGAFRPEPRHALIVAGGPEVGKINLLWGSNGKQILSDAAVLNEGTEQWTPRSFTEGDTENPIAAKAGAAYTSNQNFIYIFGGMCSTEDGEAISNELVRVDTTTGVIERMSGRGQIPCPRLGASLTFIPKDESRDELLLVFGGYTSSQEYLNDTYVYNLRACQWTRSRIEGDAPDPREGHSAIYYPGDELSGRRLIIHGGYSKIPGAAGPPETLSDVAFLNLDRGVWISQPGPNTSAPYARAKHTASLYGSKMVVIGGERSPKELLSNIAASFCLRELAWEDLELRGSGLPAEGLSGHGAVVGDNQVLVFMGRTGSEATELSEKVFSLSLSPALPPQGFQAYFDENRQGLHASWKVSRSIPGRKFELLLRRASDPVTSNIVAYTGSATSTTIKSYKDSHRKVQPFKQGETYIVEIQELDGESSSLEWFKNEERHINQLVVTIGTFLPCLLILYVSMNKICRRICKPSYKRNLRCFQSHHWYPGELDTNV